MHPAAMTKEKNSPKAVNYKTGVNEAIKVTFLTSKEVKFSPRASEGEKIASPELTTLLHDDQGVSQAPVTKASTAHGHGPIKL